MTGPDPARHVDLDVAAQVEQLLAGPPLMHLTGPIAYLRRDTTEPGHVRRVEDLTWRDLPLVLARRTMSPAADPYDTVEPVGQLTAIRVDGDIVRADATMVTADPPGTRYPVGIDCAFATVVYRDAETGAELPDDVLIFSDRPTVGVFGTAELIGATIEDPPSLPAWPDAYLEVLGPL